MHQVQLLGASNTKSDYFVRSSETDLKQNNLDQVFTTISAKIKFKVEFTL